MAEIFGIASGIAGLISVAMEITRLSYGYIADIRSAHSTQKQYLREMSALTEVLLRSEEAIEGLENETLAMSRPIHLSKNAIRDCAEELEGLRFELEKPSPSIFWPLKEKALKKHIKGLHHFRSIFSGFVEAQTLVTVSATHREVTRLGHHLEQTQIMDWIGSHKETSGTVLDPYPGTGEWFLGSDAYQNWVWGNSSSLLWCHGPPGVGKSMLASVALQHLSETLDGSSVSLLHYFCDFANRKEQRKEAIWRSLLRQFSVQGRAAALQAFAISRRQLGTSRPASLRDLHDALNTICSNEQIVVVVDAPDELKNVKELKSILCPFINNNCRILVTSRDLPDIRSALTMASILEVQADSNDLRTYVTGQFEEYDLDDLLKKHPVLQTEIINKSNGIFLLVKILVNNLLELSTVKEMRKALEEFPDHLDQAFESSLERINSQSKSHSSLAHRIFGWITSAERKLSMPELIHGLGTEEGIGIIDDENLLSPKTILKVCGGLVTTNSQDGTVSMVHITVYTWFCNRDTASFHEDLARSCLRYLIIRPLLAGPVSTAKQMDERLKSLPFLSYAAQHWRNHIIDDAMETKLTDAINVLLDSQNFRSAAFQASNYKNQLKDIAIRSASFETIPTNQSALHIAAYWNLPKKICALLAESEDLNSVDSQDWTPLHWACFAKCHKAIKILVSQETEIDAKDSVGWTPLFWTALNGDVAMVELLLINKANHLERDIYGWTALRWAVARQQTDIIRILLKHHSSKVSRFQERQGTSLKYLSVQEALRYHVKKNLKTDFLDELQDETIKASSEDNDFDDLYSVLHDESFDLSRLWHSGHFDPPIGNAWRTMNKAEEVNGVDSYIERASLGSGSLKTWRSGLLHAAIRDQKLLAVRLLIELGADVNNMKSRTPLHAAAFRKSAEFAEVLLEHGADIEALDYQGLTPLQQAVLNGFEETVKLLLSKGANVNAVCLDVSKEGAKVRSKVFLSRGGIASSKTPLMLACGLSAPPEDHDLPARMVRLLLDNGADISMKEIGPEGMTAIHYAARSRDPRIIQLVIDAGGDPQILDNYGRTSIHHLVLGSRFVAGLSQLFGSDGSNLTGKATTCLTILSQKCGLSFLSQSAEWQELFRKLYNTWKFMASIHTPLSLAILLEDWEVVHGLQRFGARFHTNIPLNTMLDGPFLALQSDAVDILLEHGATFPSEKAHWVCNVLDRFVSQESMSKDTQRLTEISVKLIPLGLDINIMDWKQESLLHKTTSRSVLCELTNSLLKIGADPCQQNGKGVDCFILASLSHNSDTLRYLLRHIEQHPLKDHWTQFIDHSENTQYLNMITAICSAIKIAGLMDFVYEVGTLLCAAAKSGNVDFVQVLLNHNADINLGNKEGQGPLHFAAEQGHTSVVGTLVHAGINLEARDENGRTPIHLSALNGHSEVVKLLLSYRASPSIPDFQGWQPLHFAAYVGDAQTVRYLIEANVSLKATTSHFSMEGERSRPSGLRVGQRWTGTPLHLAAMIGNIDVVTQLLSRKERINVNARTDDFERTGEYDPMPPIPGGGPTALHITLDTKIFYGKHSPILDKDRLRIASMLVENGANVEGVVDHLGFDDIHYFEEFPQLWDVLREGISDDD